MATASIKCSFVSRVCRVCLFQAFPWSLRHSLGERKGVAENN